MAFCSNCGTELNDGAKFCPKCGTQVGKPTNNGDTFEEKTTNVLNGNSEEDSPQDSAKKMGCWQKLGIGLVVVWAIGFIGDKCGGNKSEPSDEPKAPQAIEQTVNEQESSEEQVSQTVIEQEKAIPSEFFEKGYEYSTSYRINRQQGWGISARYTHKIKIYKDGTTEMVSSIEGDEGGGYPSKLTSCKIEKKSESYRDVSATWYEVKWNNYGEESIYVDESGNIIWLHENGNDKTIQEAITTHDCIFGQFSKRAMSDSNTSICKTCGEEYNPDKEFIVSDEYCYKDYPQICKYCDKHFTARDEGNGASVSVCARCHKRKQAVGIYESVTGRKVQ